jgi:hypothetical protein
MKEEAMSASWMTTILGIIVLVGDVGNLVTVSIEKNGIPTNATQWFYTLSGLATGIGLLVSKQFNVSNSTHPAAPATVAPAAMATPNPAAKP